jgi:hypothetical protein
MGRINNDAANAILERAQDTKASFGYMGSDSSKARVEKVQRVLAELAEITPKMWSEADYESVRQQFPQFVTFRVCDAHPKLKLKLENIQEHRQRVRFAIEIVAAHYGRSFSTVEKDWKNRKPRKAKL